MKTSAQPSKKTEAAPAREWDVNGQVTGGRHLGRFPAATGAEAVRLALDSEAATRSLCAACSSAAEDLALDRETITAHEVGGAGEVHRTGEPTTLSPAFVLVQHVWENRQEATGHSWLGVNQAMHSALRLAITAGMLFDPTDVGRMYDKLRGGYWFGEQRGEDFYSAAVASDNASACKALEAWLGRAPFMYDGRRLYLGSTIQWGELVNASVTSFARDGQSIIVCTYKDDDDDRQSKRIARRLTITLDELKVAESARKVSTKEANAVEKIRKDLHRAGIRLDASTIRAWDKPQRDAAVTWLKRPHAEHATPAPAHVLTPTPKSKARASRAA